MYILSTCCFCFSVFKVQGNPLLKRQMYLFKDLINAWRFQSQWVVSLNNSNCNVDQNNCYSCLVFPVGLSHAAKNARGQLLIHLIIQHLFSCLLCQLLQQTCKSRSEIKAAVWKFCLFVAISVWKPGIAALCRIIFCAWGCAQARLQRGWI